MPIKILRGLIYFQVYWKLNIFIKIDFTLWWPKNHQRAHTAMTAISKSDKAIWRKYSTVNTVAMKARWNAQSGIKWYAMCRFKISDLIEKQFSIYWKPNRGYINLYILFGFQKKHQTNLICLVLLDFGWGGRIWTLGITESESAALPLGDTPIFHFVICCSATYLVYHTFLCLSSLFFKFLKKIFSELLSDCFTSYSWRLI